MLQRREKGFQAVGAMIYVSRCPRFDTLIMSSTYPYRRLPYGRWPNARFITSY